MAENLYWMARHLERAENTARLVAVRSELRLDSLSPDGFFWAPALRVTGTLDDFESRGLGRSERAATTFLVSDPANPSSILSSVANARENARILREALPRETWEELAALHQHCQRPGAAAPQSRDAHLREVVARLQGLAGLFLGAMNDDAGYAVLRLGRSVERADFTWRVLTEARRTLDPASTDRQALQAAEWVGVLKSLTAYQMYRRSVRGPITGARVLRFLVASPAFPRALACCALECERALGSLPGSPGLAGLAARLSDARQDAATLDVPDLVGRLDAVPALLADLHDEIGLAWFAPQAAARQAQAQDA